MTPQDFVKTYKPAAQKCEQMTGLSYLASLTQAALESGWGKYAPGNNFFGIKDTDGVNGNEQLLQTTEYLSTPNAKFPKVISVIQKGKYWFYTVLDYFRKYDSADQSFIDHAKFFQDNSRYREAWAWRGNPEQFLRLVARAGYATAPDYELQLISTLNWFKNHA